MSAAPPPPRPDEFPRALQKALKPLIEYVKNTHIEDIRLELRPGGDPQAQPQVEFIRSDTGVLMKIVIYAAAFGGIPPPPSSGTYWLGSVNGAVGWQPTTTTCP